LRLFGNALFRAFIGWLLLQRDLVISRQSARGFTRRCSGAPIRPPGDSWGSLKPGNRPANSKTANPWWTETR